MTTWGIFKTDSISESYKKMKDESQQLDEAAVSTVAKAHGFEKVKTGFEKGSYKHPKTGETITPLRKGSEWGHSRKDGSTVSAFNHKSSLEGHLAKHGYKKTNESVESEQIEDYSLEELQEFMVSEDFEQLDELSKTTLGNYIKKAANDKADTAFHRGYSAYNNSNHKPYSEPMKNKVHRGQEKRNKGIKRAVTKLTRESVEQVEEGWDDMLKSVKDKNATQPNGGSGKKQGSRYGGGKQKDDEAQERKAKKNEAIDNVGEDIEQLDELSNDAIRSAIKAHAQKATHHAAASEEALDRHRESDHDSDYEEHEHHAEREEHHMNKIAKLKSKLKNGVKESMAAESSAAIDEEKQAEIVKMGAKEIKHANMKDKQDDAEIMEPHSEGEANFIDKHYVNVTDDPTASKQDGGAGKLGKATAPKGQGAGKYDGKGKTGVKEGTSEEGTIEEACSKEGSRKKSFSSFKAKVSK